MLAPLAAIATIVAGCGGDNGGSGGTEPATWASGFCTAITSSSANISESGTSLGGSELPSSDDTVQAVRSTAEAAGTLGDDLRALGAPDVPEGDEIQSALEGAADEAEEIFAAVEADVGGPIDDASDVAVEAGKIAEAAQNALARLGEATQRVEELDDGTLEDALESASECDGIDTG